MAAKDKSKRKKNAAKTSLKDLKIQKGHANKVKGGIEPGPETLAR